ncbi:MAG: glycoside hydrolase family 3 C-terminal domain-containing protein, partial [Bacillota bacterium]|nr:glycoside hydrolase family 3 C-terminal domain-containing protein [Bacillota bacterium]
AICPAAHFDGFAITADILEAARKAKTVLVFTGTTSELESEGHDRLNMRLPEEQYAFIERIAAVNPRTIVVNASGSAVETAPITACVPAFVQSWFGGSACGVPIAEILFGLVNPSGRLSETFPIRLENTPAYPDFPAKLGPAVYREGLFTGYRFYDTHRIPVAFPFGFGLSYTEFRYVDLTLSKSILRNGETLSVTVTVKNVGTVAGKETVQLYVAPRASLLISPTKTLKAFAKVDLAAGEQKQVTFCLSDADFASFIVHQNAFLVEKGVYGILVGASVEDLRAEADVTFDSTDETRPRLSLKHPANEWLSVEPERTLLFAVLKRAHRELRWWEYEDPVERIVARMQRDGALTAAEHAETVLILTR